MSLNPDGRENKIKLISDTMTGFYSVMRNLQEDYKTYSKNYSEEALALLSRSDDFIESVEAVRSLDSLSRIDDEGINELFLLSQQIAELYHLKVQTKIEDEKPKTLPKKIKSEKSFWNTLWGALQGEYNEDPTGMEILIDMGINFIPGVGQVCDARDITACLKKLVIDRRVNEVMIWVTLLLTAIGCVPVAGDVIKAGCKAIIKGADDAVLTVLRKLDADDVQRAFKMLRSKFTSSIEDATAMVNKWIEKAENSKYGSKVNEVLAGANEKLRIAADFVNNKIDEFGDKVFGKEKKNTIVETSGKKGNWNKTLNNELEPNKIYKVDDYSYFTDEAGRVNKVSGELKLETKDRNIYQQGKSVEIKDGVRGKDQGGHIIARIFNGPGEQINYVPQTATLNNGEWKTMEKKWNDALSEGKKVEVNIKINYADNLRPTDFDVTYIIKTSDGKIEKTENLFFLN